MELSLGLEIILAIILGIMSGGCCVIPNNIYSEISLNRPTMRPTLGGPFKEMVGLGSKNINMDDSLGPK